MRARARGQAGARASGRARARDAVTARVPGRGSGRQAPSDAAGTWESVSDSSVALVLVDALSLCSRLLRLLLRDVPAVPERLCPG